MPRELVKALNANGGIHVNKWVDKYFVRDNYPSSRCAILVFKEKKLNGDLVYSLRQIKDDYAQAKIDSFNGVFNSNTGVNFCVLLLERPRRFTDEAIVVKRDDDSIIFNQQRTGVLHAWDVSLDSDYSIIQNCIFHAAGKDTARKEAIDNIDVALSVSSVHKFFYDNVDELRRLTQTVYDTPTMRDTMQKYLAAIFMQKPFGATQLETMYQTVVQRNMRHSNGRLNPDSLMAFLVLMPIIRMHFDWSADAYTQAPAIYAAYKRAVADLPPASQPEKRILAMGRIFGAVAKEATGKYLRNLHDKKVTVDLRYTNDACSWIAPSGFMRLKAMSPDHVRVVGKMVDRITTVEVDSLDEGNALGICVHPLVNDVSRVKCCLSTSSTNKFYLDPGSYIVSRAGSDLVVRTSQDTSSSSSPDDELWQLPAKSKITLVIQFAAVEMSRSLSGAETFRPKYEQDMCCICLDDLAKDRQRVLVCGHRVHCTCLQQWHTISRNACCPICKMMC